MKTYGDVAASRRSLRSARLSRADIGCTLASPLLALRTCKRPVARSMSSQRSATSSEALRPWTMAVSDQDSRGVPMPRAVLLGGLDEPLDLPVGEIFTAALANCYIYAVGAASRRREFFMETALPPVRSPAPPDIAEELGGS